MSTMRRSRWWLSMTTLRGTCWWTGRVQYTMENARWSAKGLRMENDGWLWASYEHRDNNQEAHASISTTAWEGFGVMFRINYKSIAGP